MTVSMKITLAKKNKKGSPKLNRYSVKLPKTTEKGMRLAGALLVGQIQRFLTGPSKTIDPSRIYPGVVTQKLRSSIKAVVDPGKEPSLKVGPNVFYAIYLELGTSTIKAIPFIFPAWTKRKKDVLKVIKKQIMKPLKR